MKNSNEKQLLSLATKYNNLWKQANRISSTVYGAVREYHLAKADEFLMFAKQYSWAYQKAVEQRLLAPSTRYSYQ